MTEFKVYKAISNVAQELIEKGGIEKEKAKGENGKPKFGAPDYAFRGIDQVYNALAPALTKHGLVILPRIVERQVTERTSSQGKPLFYVVVKGEFDFVSTEDGSKHTIQTYGEAMDSGDKATNKAMSIAYKYAAFQAFCIPTEETTQDADNQTHELSPDGVPAVNKPVLTPESKAWNNAINSYKEHGNLDLVKEHMIVSYQAEQMIKDHVATEKADDKPF